MVTITRRFQAIVSWEKVGIISNLILKLINYLETTEIKGTKYKTTQFIPKKT